MYNTFADVIYYWMIFLIVSILLGITASYEPLRYYIKVFLITLAGLITGTIHYPFMFLRMGDSRNALLPLRVIYKVVNLIGVTIEFRGEENIVRDSGCILLGNHQSLLDLAVIAKIWQLFERCTVIVKKEILYYGPFGLGCWLAGVIFIDRQKSKESQEMLKAAVKPIKDRKATVIIAPEGRRNGNSTLLPFKKGPFHLAIDTQLPIQPVVLSKYYFLNAKKKLFNSGTIYVTILPPIPTKGLTKEDLPKLMEDTYRIMNNCFVETSQEVIDKTIKPFRDLK